MRLTTGREVWVRNQAAPYPGVQISTSEPLGKPDEMLGVNLAMDWYPIHRGVAILSHFIIQKLAANH